MATSECERLCGAEKSFANALRQSNHRTGRQSTSRNEQSLRLEEQCRSFGKEQRLKHGVRKKRKQVDHQQAEKL